MYFAVVGVCGLVVEYSNFSNIVAAKVVHHIVRSRTCTAAAFLLLPMGKIQLLPPDPELSYSADQRAPDLTQKSLKSERPIYNVIWKWNAS